MLRILLLLSLLVSSSGFSTEDFKSKTAALNYLSFSNIYVAGMPEYKLDSKKGVLHITLERKEGFVTYHLNLAKLNQVVLLTKEVTSISITCKDKDCVQVQTGSGTLSTSKMTLVMQSTFEDGDSKDDYLEKGSKIAEAINYLSKFYK